MPSIKFITKTVTLSCVSLLLTVFMPSASSISFADSSNQCSPPSSTQPGVHWPTGADAAAFTYQCSGPYAGEWTSAYYVYDPTTQQRTPTYDPDYQYDCTASQWTMVDWFYSPADGQYHQTRVAGTPPAGTPTGCPVVASSSTTPGSNSSGSDTGTTPGVTPDVQANTAGPNSPTGTGGSTVNTNANSSLNSNNSLNATMNNTIAGVAASGNSLVLGNTSAGNATSGNTQDIADIVNLLQSSTNALGAGSNVITFTDNIDGDVNGDLLLNPAQLANVQNAAANTNLASTVTVNNASNAAINNNVNLAADSGNAGVENNTSAGNATSGNADTVANIVNTIDSAITAGQSFIGTININGNLNGDILLPADFVNQLLADNVPTVTITAPNSTNTSNNTSSSNTNITNTNNLGITNNVNAGATTGSASVSNNTSGGSAASGNATTNITAFNLTGSNVIGANDLLVFVNAPNNGWVGLIVGAPPGTTAAELGGGITQNSSSLNNTAVTNTTNDAITNNVNLASQSGDANVNSNTKGGNATSGNASSVANLANIENSDLSLSGWFGILFINVFGTWNGSFGINTAAGDPAPAVVGTAGSSTMPVQVFSFIATPKGGHGHGSSGSVGGTTTDSSGSGTSLSGSVLAASKVADALSSRAPTPQLQSSHSDFTLTAGIIAACVVSYIIADAVYTHRKATRH